MVVLKPLFMASAMGLLMGSVVALPSSDTKSQSVSTIETQPSDLANAGH